MARAPMPVSGARLVTTVRQWRADLFGSCRVVEHQQHATIGSLGTKAGLKFIQRRRQFGIGNPQVSEETAQHRLRRQHLVVAVPAAEVHVQLPIGEPFRHPVSPLDGQGRLAHARRPGDGDEGNLLLRGRAGKEPVQLLHM
jgi:hypothetical protein